LFNFDVPVEEARFPDNLKPIEYVDDPQSAGRIKRFYKL
jgi:hypothetical protein